VTGFDYVRCAVDAAGMTFCREYMDRVSTLQDDVPAEEYAYMKEIIEEFTGEPIYETFRDFTHTPLGSPSIGQVSHAEYVSPRRLVGHARRGDVCTLLRTW
jgi:predicted unusual protein kinase regulating ubiquinone biosynthesis (AarF/ABC1/UbiB family)